MRTVTYNLQQFLIEAKRGAFIVPRFQRDFVWNDAQVKLLVDSIAHNYPIGSLLLLHETDPAAPFLASRSVNAVIRESELTDDDCGGTTEKPPPAVHYVLDGQQRLTSLVRVFLQSTPNAHYYFDLKELLKFDESDRSSSNWVIRRKPSARLPNRYLRSDIITEPEKCQVLVEEYFEQNEDTLTGDRPAQRRASAKVNRIFETVRNYQVPLVIIDRGESTEAICRIFETINSTGTRLTTFDLAVARFFPKPDLQSLWTESQTQLPILKRFEAEGERVLQGIALLRPSSKTTSMEVTRGTLLGLTREEISDGWRDAASALAEAYEWTESRGAVPKLLANEGLLVALAFFLKSASKRWRHANSAYGTILERWYFANILQQGAKQAANYRVAQAAGELRTWINEGKTPSIPLVRLTVDELLRLPKSDNRYRGLHALMRWKCGRDFWTGEVLDSDDVEDHHIFPAALSKREGIPQRMLDSIANRLLIATQTNRTLGDQLPRDYMNRLHRDALRSTTWDSKTELLRDACIPVPEDAEEFASQFEQGRIESFLHARATLILEMVGKLLGDAFQSDASSASSADDE